LYKAATTTNDRRPGAARARQSSLLVEREGWARHHGMAGARLDPKIWTFDGSRNLRFCLTAI